MAIRARRTQTGGLGEKFLVVGQGKRSAALADALPMFLEAPALPADRGAWFHNDEGLSSREAARARPTGYPRLRPSRGRRPALAKRTGASWDERRVSWRCREIGWVFEAIARRVLGTAVAHRPLGPMCQTLHNMVFSARAECAAILASPNCRFSVLVFCHRGRLPFLLPGSR